MTNIYPRTDMLNYVSFVPPYKFYLMDRQDTSRQADGRLRTKDLGTPIWMAEFRTEIVRLGPGMAYENMLRTLDGGIRSFESYDLRRPFPLAHPRGNWGQFGSTLANAGFESGLAGWSGSGSMATSDSRSGTGAALLDKGSVSGGSSRTMISDINTDVAIIAGETYEISAWLKTEVAGGTFVAFGITWYNSANVLISATNPAAVTPTTSYARYAGSLVAPAGAVSARARITLPSSTATCRYLYVDDVAITRPSGASFAGICAISAVGSDNRSLRLSGLPGGVQLSVGDYLAYDLNGRRRLHQVSEAALTPGGGVTPFFEVRPYLPAGITTGIAVNIARPAALMAVEPGSISADLNSGMDMSVSFRAVQVI